ncbi:hypothetical protein ABT033_02140 [Streptomyces pharetrae]|uniref:hypothetical protein n=1 Tax=Streptomyces pharetrae TaxID=291370 RepID=UPI0033501C19
MKALVVRLDGVTGVLLAGPAHLAAATGAPVVPLVPPGGPRRPHGGPSVLLDPDAGTAQDVARAVHRLLDGRT